ncbi:hypothetical protein BGZ83_008013 [Gryganskiella cystojenkinii]|nr:hypothetical protein BGZ83_008013 [Gryganskiella cystojenkinii]
MPSYSSLTIPALYQTSRLFAPRSMAALRQAQFSSKANKSDIVTFEEIDTLVRNKDKNVVLIDVREAGEVAQGVIPTSHHIPLANIQEALSLPEKEFEDRFGFHKPAKNDEIVLYCRSGRRSGMAFEVAKSLGYNGVRNYSGSWLDYESKTKGQ